MLEQARQRTECFQARLADAGIDVAVLTDDSTIAYFAGFWGYLSVEFGRPTFLIVRPESPPTVITPLMESEMVSSMTWVDDIMTWEDSGSTGWETVLARALADTPVSLGIEAGIVPAMVRNWLDAHQMMHRLCDISPIVAGLRMIKSPEEIRVMRQAGEIAGAMMEAAAASLHAGAPEYEAALAVIQAGTRKAAGFLTDRGWEAFVSPMIHNLQIMQSGSDTSMVHRRASVRRMQRGDPVYFCFCNMAQFKHYRLGFDRMFFVGKASDEAAKVQQAAIDAQQAAIAAIRPGVTAASVAEAANDVYRARGYESGYRTGRSIGMSYLEAPELKRGDMTILQPGMTFAVDGGISVDSQLGGRIGDSVVVTEEGAEYLTHFSREILIADAAH